MANVIYKTVSEYRRGFKFWECYVHYEVIYKGKVYKTKEYRDFSYEGTGKEEGKEEVVEYSSEEEFVSKGFDEEINEILKGTPLHVERKPVVVVIDKPRGWTVSINGTEITQKKAKAICQNYNLTKETIADYIADNIRNIRYDYYGNILFFLN